MKIVVLDKKCMPFKKHERDAGWDLFLREDVFISPHKTVKAPSGICVELGNNTFGDIKPRSSTFIKDVNISGVIDSDFRGEIQITIHNSSDFHKSFSKYDKIAQMIITVCKADEKLEVVELLSKTERDDGAFGSTD
jgi:dUTP pyrophosphatase